ncbi:MAG: DUF6714 family protein [Planctomycetota bacterium]
MEPRGLKEQIVQAFAEVEPPPHWCLSNSREGEEPARVEQEFRGKDDWRVLDADFLDLSPGGLASALSFFSDEAFRFYLPAYLLAHIDDRLRRVDPTFHLTHGLDEASRHKRVNPRRYGERTWFDVATHKFAMFTREQAQAVAAYLQFVHEREPDESITQALTSYWSGRAGA